MRYREIGLMTYALMAATGAAEATDPTSFARSAEVQTIVASMMHDIKPSEEMLYRPLLKQPSYTVAVEYWVRPKQAASHLTETEFVTVLAGSGTLVSGGTLTDAKHWYGDTDGGTITGGTTRPLRPGDVVLVPAGTPHWFGIKGSRLVLLTMHVPQPSPAPAH